MWTDPCALAHVYCPICTDLQSPRVVRLVVQPPAVQCPLGRDRLCSTAAAAHLSTSLARERQAQREHGAERQRRCGHGRIIMCHSRLTSEWYAPACTERARVVPSSSMRRGVCCAAVVGAPWPHCPSRVRPQLKKDKHVPSARSLLPEHICRRKSGAELGWRRRLSVLNHLYTSPSRSQQRVCCSPQATPMIASPLSGFGRGWAEPDARAAAAAAVAAAARCSGRRDSSSWAGLEGDGWS